MFASVCPPTQPGASCRVIGSFSVGLPADHGGATPVPRRTDVTGQRMRRGICGSHRKPMLAPGQQGRFVCGGVERQELTALDAGLKAMDDDERWAAMARSVSRWPDAARGQASAEPGRSPPTDPCAYGIRAVLPWHASPSAPLGRLRRHQRATRIARRLPKVCIRQRAPAA